MPSRKPIRVLANSSEIIEVLSKRGPLTPAEIAEVISVPRPTAYRLVGGLNAIGLTHTAPDSRVALSLRWLHLADTSLIAMREWSESRRVLDRLAATTEQTAFLSVPRDDEAVCIDWAPGRGIGVLILKPGRALPFHAGAAGRTMLAFAPDLDEFLAAAPFAPFTKNTLTGETELRADVERSRRDGYTFSDEDATDGIGAIGVPILAPSGQLVGCVSIGGLARDMHAHRDQFVRAVNTAAAELAGAYAS